jgi:hypothetical protein
MTAADAKVAGLDAPTLPARRGLRRTEQGVQHQ